MAVLVRVVDCQGFSAAGRQLRLTTAVVSSRIARLEQRLGVQLLNRTTRSVQPTEEGRVYYDHCQRVLAEVQNAEQMLAELKQKPAGTLRVSVPIGLGRKYVAPLVPRFLQAHPGIQLRLQATDRVVDLVGEEVDVAVRKGALADSTLVRRRIAPDLRVVCGSPAYFKQHGIPATPDGLKEHNCLLLRFPGSLRYCWTFQTPAGEAVNLRLRGSMDSDSSDVLVDWALAGHGLIMKSVWDVAPHLASRQLVGCLREFWPRDLPLSAVMPPRRPQPRKTRNFIDFLVDQFSQLPPLKFADPANVPQA